MQLAQSKRRNVWIVRISPLNALQTISFFFKFNKNHLLIKLGCYTKRLLLVQPDFQAQKYEIEEFIQNLPQGQYHMVFYYPKFHCKLNHIKDF